jgi:hypothetical protein
MFANSNGHRGAQIQALSDGTWGTNDYPGALTFSTTADGASSPTERLRIDSSGRVGIGISSPQRFLDVKSSSSADYVAQFTDSNAAKHARIYVDANGVGFVDTDFSNGIEFASNTARTYVNGSERLRIDSSGRLLVGTSSSYGSANSDDLTIGDRTQSEVGITLGSTVASAIRFADAGNVSAGIIQYVHNSGGTDYMNFYTNSNERLRIDSSGNVGIGGTTVTDSNLLNIQGSSATSNIGLVFNDTNTSKIYGIQNGGSALKVFDYTTSTERLRIDSSGRLLVGTSSTSASCNALLQKADGTGGTLILSRGTTSPADGNDLGFISFNDSSHIHNSAIIRAQRDGGTWTSGSSMPTRLVFSTTADGASSPTERMRIDSSGNVGIGENNPSMPLMVKSDRTGGKNIFDLNNQKANHYGGLRVTLGETDRECRLTATYGSSFMSFFTAASTGAATERMRIDSAGIFLGNSSSTFNVFANTNPAAKMHLSGGGGGSANIEIHGASHASDAKVITFDTNSSERMRIDSSGRLLVGTTSPDGRLTINGETSGATSNAINVRNSAGQAMFTVRNDGRIATGGAGSPYNKTTGTGANAVFGSDGVFYRSTSSLKYKTNVQNASHGLQKVLALRPVTYEGTSEVDAGITFGGLIAEEVHDTGLTEFVQYAEDGSPDALAYGPMVSLCIKAIQEQQVVIAELQAEVADLKGQ